MQLNRYDYNAYLISYEVIPNNRLHRVNVSPVNFSSLRSNELNAATLFKQSTVSSQCFSGEFFIVEE